MDELANLLIAKFASIGPHVMIEQDAIYLMVQEIRALYNADLPGHPPMRQDFDRQRLQGPEQVLFLLSLL